MLYTYPIVAPKVLILPWYLSAPDTIDFGFCCYQNWYPANFAWQLVWLHWGVQRNLGLPSTEKKQDTLYIYIFLSKLFRLQFLFVKFLSKYLYVNLSSINQSIIKKTLQRLNLSLFALWAHTWFEVSNCHNIEKNNL